MCDPRNLRTAVATDIHQFSTDVGRPMWLACLQWPGVTGLEGHSDADVAAHAVADAILIASGVGELGSVFGVGRPEFSGASGARLLGESARLVREAGWDIINASVQIIGPKPRFSPRKKEAEEAMTSVLGAPCTVAATTTDHLGFPGRGEGLAAVASALVYKLPSTRQ